MTHKYIKFLLFALIVFQVPLLAGEAVEWKTDWQTELPKAAANGQPVLMDVYTDWCPHCKRLDKTTFIDKSVLDFFKKEKYVLLKVNPEKDIESEKKFRAFSYPTLIVFNPKGKEIDRILGYRDAKQLVKELSDAQKGIGTLDDLLKKYEKTKGKPTEENFALLKKIIDKYVAKADYPDALKLVAEVVRLDKDNKLGKAAAALSTKGYIYYKWKKLRKAVDFMLDIHRIYPKSKEAQYGFQAAAYYAKKLKDKSLQLLVLKKYVAKYPEGKGVEKAKKMIEKLEKK